MPTEEGPLKPFSFPDLRRGERGEGRGERGERLHTATIALSKAVKFAFLRNFASEFKLVCKL
jgi:hypothetical protein